MKNSRMTKPVICLIGLICYIFPFFKFTCGASVPGLDLLGGITQSISINVSGVQVFASMQYMAGIIRFTEIDMPVIWWVIYLIMTWVAVPFLFMAAMGVMNLLRQDKTTRVLTIIGGAVNAVMIAGVLIYFTVKPGQVPFGETPVSLSFTGAWGLWLLLVVNITMFVLGIYQKSEAAVKTAEAIERKTPGGGVLVGMNGSYSGSRIPIEAKSELVIGRDSTACNLIVSGSKVSRKHCAVKYDPGMQVYRVIDYSTNGTFSGDGSRLLSNQYSTLKKGSIIYLGDQSNMFQLE